MAPRDASRVQLDFPQLTADIIAQLRLTGVVGLLEFLDSIRPVYIVAAREGALNIVATLPVFTSPSIAHGSLNNPAANAVIADTGQLPAGDYDVWANMNSAGSQAAEGPLELQHRDAANAVTLAVLLRTTINGGSETGNNALPLIGYQIGTNERLRMINAGGVVNGEMGGSIGALLRPTP